MREQGKKVGFLRVKYFRPFATDEIRQALSQCKAVAVIDRDFSLGSPTYGGVLFNDIRSALYGADHRPNMYNFIAGLGGREVRVRDVDDIVTMVQDALTTGKNELPTSWLNVRE
jgi:pyruvate ferredoxin oxidoreductase alpha subunit